MPRLSVHLTQSSPWREAPEEVVSMICRISSVVLPRFRTTATPLLQWTAGLSPVRVQVIGFSADRTHPVSPGMWLAKVLLNHVICGIWTYRRMIHCMRPPVQALNWAFSGHYVAIHSVRQSDTHRKLRSGPSFILNLALTLMFLSNFPTWVIEFPILIYAFKLFFSLYVN